MFFLFLLAACQSAILTRMPNAIDRSYIIVLEDLDDGLSKSDGEILFRQHSVLDRHLDHMHSLTHSLPRMRLANGEDAPAFLVTHKYENIPSFFGYSATLSEQALWMVLEDPLVASVEEDAILEADIHSHDTFFQAQTSSFNAARTKSLYLMLPANTNSCQRETGGSHRRMNEAECRAMVSSGFAGSAFGYVHSDTVYPRGCYLYSNGQVYFNSGSGASRSSSRPICMSNNPTGGDTPTDTGTCVRQTNAIWNLPAINHGRATTSTTTYRHTSNAGSGVDIYIFDTGIRRSHRDFGGRASWGFDAFTSSSPHRTDRNGHGTHVASSAAGAVYGVAKRANLIDVRVLGDDGRGSSSGYAAGLDWAVAETRRKGRTSIMNASLGFSSGSGTVDRATEAATRYMLCVVSSGNSGGDSCIPSPSRSNGVLSVGNARNNNARSSSSNFGACTHIWGPGSSIVAASHTSDTGTRSLSGTSMSAPHVAGVAAIYLAENPSLSPSALRRRVLETAQSGSVTDVRGSANLYARYRNCDA
jgi:hypothetical protein